MKTNTTMKKIDECLVMGVIILLSSFNNPTVHNEGSDKTCPLQANHKEISSSEVY
jgi:hypothetical protein